jgi:hypothetical protein
LVLVADEIPCSAGGKSHGVIDDLFSRYLNNVNNKKRKKCARGILISALFIVRESRYERLQT